MSDGAELSVTMAAKQHTVYESANIGIYCCNIFYCNKMGTYLSFINIWILSKVLPQGDKAEKQGKVTNE